jgi:hypothetical protein
MNLNSKYNSGGLNNTSNMFDTNDNDLDTDTSTQQTGGGSRVNGPTLFTHLFSFDHPYKSDVFNVLQYSFTSLIPIVLLNKLIQSVIPEASTQAGTAEICMEIIGQLGILLVGLILIHRFATYFNTYSGEPYPKHSILCFVLGLMTVLISIQSRLGEKINIIFDRIMDYWNGPAYTPTYNTKSKNRRISDTVPDVQVMGRLKPQMSQDTTQISSLPVVSQSLNTQPIQPNGPGYDTPPQYATNYDTNVRSNNGGNPEQPWGSDEPSAANAMMGGSFGSVW